MQQHCLLCSRHLQDTLSVLTRHMPIKFDAPNFPAHQKTPSRSLQQCHSRLLLTEAWRSQLQESDQNRSQCNHRGYNLICYTENKSHCLVRVSFMWEADLELVVALLHELGTQCGLPACQLLLSSLGYSQPPPFLQACIRSFIHACMHSSKHFFFH